MHMRPCNLSRHSHLEGRRPRRLVATRTIKRINTCVPVGTEAGAPPIEFHVAFVPVAGEAAGPPFTPAIMRRFARTRDGRP